MQNMTRSRSDRGVKNSVTHTATRTSIFYQIRDTKHVSLSIFRQKNEYTKFTQNLGFRGTVTLTYEGKTVALIRRCTETVPQVRWAINSIATAC